MVRETLRRGVRKKDETAGEVKEHLCLMLPSTFLDL
jgi:hypothetical protein